MTENSMYDIEQFATLKRNKIVKVTPGRLSKNYNLELESSSKMTLRSTSESEISYVNVISSETIFEFTFTNFELLGKRDSNEAETVILLKWNIFNFQDSLTFPCQNCEKQDFAHVIKYEVNDEFFDILSSLRVFFKLCEMTDFGNENYMGTGTLCVNLLENFGKQQVSVVKFFNYQEFDTKHPKKIAVLTLYHRFICNRDVLQTIIARQSTHFKQDSESFKIAENEQQAHLINDNEIRDFKNSLQIELQKGKALKRTQSQISNDLKDAVKLLHLEAQWKLTLQENAILRGQDPDKIPWRQWRDSKTEKLRIRAFLLEMPKFQPKLEITLEKIKIHKGDPDWEQIYIELVLIDTVDQDVETPKSLPYSDDYLVYNFTKKISIDVTSNYKDCEKLAEIVKSNGSVRFIIMCEPHWSKGNFFSMSYEIGYTEINMLEMVELEVNEFKDDFDIISWVDHDDVIGYATIKIKGAMALRKMALYLLSPPSFKKYYSYT